MTMELKEAGLDVGECRVGRLMRIKPVRTHRHKVTTDSHHRRGVAANWLDGNFTGDAPNQKWAGEPKGSAAASGPRKGCILHSGRGSQYCSYGFKKKLQPYGLQLSMSGKGNCYDNAAVETFFKA
jgi:transposase InsO family protein